MVHCDVSDETLGPGQESPKRRMPLVNLLA